MKLLLLMMATFPLTAASDMTGKWIFEGDVAGNPVNLTCSMKQGAEAKITGTCTVAGGEEVSIEGDTKQEKVTFSFTAQGYLLTYTGKLDGNAMSGEISVAGASGTFSGKRDAS